MEFSKPKSSRRSGARPTMRDVADRAGVSQMTVSFVVNGTKKVSEATHRVVTAAIADLGYVPNQIARHLASADDLRIGLLYSSTPNAFLSALLVGVLNAASRIGAQVHIERFDSAYPQLVDTALQQLARGGATAVLLSPPVSEIAASSPGWRALGLNAVAVAPGASLPGLPSVRIDETGAARDMTSLLLDRGHARIGFIVGPPVHSASAARLEGYHLAHRRRRLPVDPQLIIPGDFSFESGVAGARRLLDLAAPPSAIFASNDAMASGVLALAQRRGLRIPDDLSVAGFDDTPIATQVWPPLTTVGRDVIAMAEKGVEMLAAMARARALGRDLEMTDCLVDYALVERQSVAV